MLKLNAFTKPIKTATQEAGFTVIDQEGMWLHVVLHDQTIRCDLAPLACEDAPQLIEMLEIVVDSSNA
ncbi:MAG: hypothetical protein KJ063_25010 [Anaerolineae bacterium]|nr:hypothetical protein [Anaerolineae bacterium]